MNLFRMRNHGEKQQTLNSMLTYAAMKSILASGSTFEQGKPSGSVSPNSKAVYTCLE